MSKIERGVEGPNGMIDAFALTTPDRVYTFACANDREVRQWLDALKPYVNATGKVPEIIKEGWLVKQGGSVKVGAASPLGSTRASATLTAAMLRHRVCCFCRSRGAGGTSSSARTRCSTTTRTSRTPSRSARSTWRSATTSFACRPPRYARRRRKVTAAERGRSLTP